MYVLILPFLLYVRVGDSRMLVLSEYLCVDVTGNIRMWGWDSCDLLQGTTTILETLAMGWFMFQKRVRRSYVLSIRTNKYVSCTPHLVSIYSCSNNLKPQSMSVVVRGLKFTATSALMCFNQI